MRILVTGGAGSIGSVVTEELLRAGHHAVVLDNLSQGHRKAVPAAAELVEAVLLDAATLLATLKTQKIEAVIHMAAHSSIEESCEHPEKYHRNNVVAGIALLDAMHDAGVKQIVFLSTAEVLVNFNFALRAHCGRDYCGRDARDPITSRFTKACVLATALRASRPRSQ